MKKKQLEIFLQQIPVYSKPNPRLEQYITPANIAADIVYIAYGLGDIKNKTVLDLGCGTGIFSVGVTITGARRVIGVDIDKRAIDIAKSFAVEQQLGIEYIVQDIDEVDLECDTVIMNPPFGAQKSNKKADRKFIEKAFQISSVAYSLHLTKTIDFIEKMVSSLKGEIDFTKKYNFPIKSTYHFHSKKTQFFDITLLRILTKK